MITALALAAAALVPAVPANALPKPTAVRAAPVAEVTTLADAVGLVQITEENRTGYTRSSFKHWNAGENPSDGCNTRIICIARWR